MRKFIFALLVLNFLTLNVNAQEIELENFAEESQIQQIEINDKEQQFEDSNTETSTTLMAEPAKSNVLNGLQKINGNMYFYKNGVMQKGIQIIDGKKYFFGEIQGGLKYGFVTALNGDKYYTGTDGIIKTGIQPINGTTYYFNENGVMQKGIQIIDGKKYFFGEIQGGLKYGFVTALNGDKYYTGTDGIIKTGIQPINGTTYYFNENGVMQKGIQIIDGKKYFFGEIQGGLKYGFVTALNGNIYYTGTDGIIKTGIQPINDKKYFFGEVQGTLKYGFVTALNGDKYYTGTDGIIKTGIQTINGKKYGFNEDGVMQVGMQSIGGITYYFNEDGVMQKGIQIIDGKKYFFGEIQGGLKYGFVTALNGNIYYTGTDGIIKTGIQPINDKKYFFGEVQGTLKYGFVTALNGKVYYTGTDGIIKTGRQSINGVYYDFDGEGILQSGWTTGTNGSTYYVKDDGRLANDWIIIDGQRCFFNSLGVLIGKNVERIIDISTHQKTIDWNTLWKSNLIDGVIVRIGYGSENLDGQWYNNIAEIQRLGIPYGIYLFSYAENAAGAKSEANFIIDNFKGLNPTLGIYYDIESWSYYENGIFHTTDNISAGTYEQIIGTFVDTIKNSNTTKNYNVEVYSGKKFAETRFTAKSREFVTWIAQYNHYCTYTGSIYNMWQYGGEYYPGIDGIVDTNVRWKN